MAMPAAIIIRRWAADEASFPTVSRRLAARELLFERRAVSARWSSAPRRPDSGERPPRGIVAAYVTPSATIGPWTPMTSPVKMRFRVAAVLAMASGSLALRPGFPGSFPRARAALMPAFVRSEISTVQAARPRQGPGGKTCPGVSKCRWGRAASENRRRFSSRRSMTSRRWLTERASRSRRATTRTSPGLISRTNRASSGRARDAPDPCSL
jgi:hypothetical protein